MKKLLSLVLTFLLLITLIGCTKEKDKGTKENSSPQETVVVEKTYKKETVKKAQAEKQQTVKTEIAESEIQEVLSAEDKAVKAEIAKHVETDVDFRQKKQEMVQGKNYDLAFSGMDSDVSPKNIVYKAENGDEFKYVIETGKLRHINLYSNITEKTKDSIDIETAHKIALELFPKNRNINEYTRNYYKEKDDGYVIWYTRYIGGYFTTDSFRVKIAFDGSIVEISDVTEVFEGKNIDFDKEFIDSKIQEYVSEKGDIEVSYTMIEADDDGVYASCSFKQVTQSGHTSSFKKKNIVRELSFDKKDLRDFPKAFFCITKTTR